MYLQFGSIIEDLVSLTLLLCLIIVSLGGREGRRAKVKGESAGRRMVQIGARGGAEGGGERRRKGGGEGGKERVQDKGGRR